MLLWANGGTTKDPQSPFDGTLRSLSRFYQADKDSPFRALRYRTRRRFGVELRMIETALGDVRVKNITFRDPKRWFAEFAAPDVLGGRRKLTLAYQLMARLKQILKFGKLALPESSGCERVVKMFEELEFAGGQPRRKQYRTYEQAKLICEEAHRRGLHSIALTEAIMFECGVRQKDVIGEWIPRTEPGVTDVFSGASKWLMGARWEEIDANFVWKHRLGKSVKGAANVMEADVGKTELFDLLAFPMVRSELERIAPLNRGKFPASGPVIIYEGTGRPWTHSFFCTYWRQCARAVGIPDEMQSRDSRAGAATEADRAGVPREKVRRFHGHSDEETTAIYQRESMEIRSEIARTRAVFRKQRAEKRKGNATRT